MNTHIHVYMYMSFDKQTKKNYVTMKWTFIKYIHNLFHRAMGERFRRELSPSSRKRDY